MRRLRLGLLTVLGLARRGFFIPYRYANTLPQPGRNPSYPPLAALMTAAEPAFAALLRDIDSYEAALQAMGDAPPPRPALDPRLVFDLGCRRRLRHCAPPAAEADH